MSLQLTKPAASYPHFRRAGSIVYLAGQGCRDPETDECAGLQKDATGKIIGYDITAQTLGVLKNIERALSAAGLSKSDLVDVNVFLKNMDDFAAMNAVWNDWAPDPAPTRTTVAVVDLPVDNYIEMKAIAAMPNEV